MHEVDVQWISISYSTQYIYLGIFNGYPLLSRVNIIWMYVCDLNVILIINNQLNTSQCLRHYWRWQFFRSTYWNPENSYLPKQTCLILLLYIKTNLRYQKVRNAHLQLHWKFRCQINLPKFFHLFVFLSTVISHRMGRDVVGVESCVLNTHSCFLKNVR